MRKVKRIFECKEHYSIRKLTVGVASVMVGLSFLGFNSVAKADTTKDKVVENQFNETSSSNEKKTEQTASEAQETNVSDANVNASLNKDNSKEEISNQVDNKVTPSANDLDDKKDNHITAEDNQSKQDGSKEKTSKADISSKSEEESSKVETFLDKNNSKKEISNQVDNRVNPNTDDSDDKKDNHITVKDNQSKQDIKDSTSETAPAAQTPKKADINDWVYSTDTNKDINLTDYNGNDKVNIVIPNDQDFIQAGKLDKGHAVKITSTVMHDIVVKDKPQSIIISKNNNGKVIAADSDWSNAFGGDSTSKTEFTSGILLANPKLKKLDLTNLDTHNITNFSKMFYYGSNLTGIGDLSNWDVSNGENFSMMFRNASSLTNVGDLSNWDLSKGTDFTGMFNQARHIKSLGNLSGWKVANGKSFANMFRDTWNLHDIGDLSNWDVSNSKSTEWMFGNSALDKINISGWDLSNATDFNNMFQGEPFTEVYNNSTKLWVPQTVHHDKIIIANDIKLPKNADKIVEAKDFAGGNSHQFVITNNQVLLNLETADIKNNVTVMDKQNDTLFSFVMPSFFEVHDMNNIEKEIKDQIIDQLEMKVDWYDRYDRQEGMLGYTTSQLKAITSPITQELTISDNKQIGTLTLRTQNGDKVENVKVPLIWNIDQIEKNVVRKVIAKLPNSEEKLLKTQVVRYRRNIKWDKLLIGTPIEFTDWQLVPGTVNYWNALVLTDKPYTPSEDEKATTDVVDINVPGYTYKDMQVVDENDNENSKTVGGSQKIDPDSGNEYIYLNYTAKQYKANFKFVNDQSGWAYPRYKASEEMTYDNSIAIPSNYANYQSTLTQPVFTKDHLKLSYIEYDGKQYQPNEITNLKCPDHDVEFTYHLVPDASVITYKDVTGLDEKDYDSKGVIITDLVMKNLDIDPNPTSGKWDDNKNGWNYQAANWTFDKSVSPDKVNLTVYLKANDKSIKRVIKYVDGNGHELLPIENTSMTVNHTVGDFESNLSPKYNGNLSGDSVFQIPSTKEKDNETYYFDVNSDYFKTGAKKGENTIVDNGITVDKLANTITVKVPKTVESGTTYTFVLPYVQSHINLIYKDVTGLKNDQYDSQAKNIEGHDKQYTGQPDMPFIIDKNVWDYEKDGWELASSDEMEVFPGKNHNYNQDYVIYLKHGSEDAYKTVTETIEYQLADGTKLPGLTYENAVTLKGTRDKVTGEASYSEQKLLPAVKIPTKKGYTASVDGKSATEIAEITVKGDTKDSTKTVIYTPDAQEAMVEYVDDDNNHALIAQSPVLKGVTEGQIKYSTAKTLKDLEAEGYVLVKDGDETKTKSMVFDNDDDSDQLYYVHLKHGSEDAYKTVTETIEYQLADGTKLPGLTYENAVTLKGTRDKVTGEASYSEQKLLPAVAIPSKKGYTASVDGKVATEIKAIPVNGNTLDITKTVIYTPNAQHAMVEYIDDTENKVIVQSLILNGATDEKINYSTDQIIKSLEEEGYELVQNSDETKVNPMVFDNDDNSDQLFRVHFVHKLTAQSDNITRHRTIKYFDGETGKSLEDKAKSVTQDVIFKNTALRDAITKQIVGYNTSGNKDMNGQLKIDTTNVNESWLPYDIDSFAEVISPDLTKDGYKQTPSFELHKDNKDAEKVVSSKADPAKDASDVNVYYFHDTESAVEHAKAKEIIHYVYANTNAKIHNDYISPEISYTRAGVMDKVTKQIKWKNWKSDNGQSVFVKQPSPHIDGYKPDYAFIPEQTINTAELIDNKPYIIEKTVKYTANTQKLTVEFIDDTTGKVLNTVNKNGDSNTSANYNTKQDIDNYKANHYELVSDSTNGADLVFDANDQLNQNYEVHLIHTYKAIIDKSQTEKTVTETIKYVYANGDQAKPDYTKSVTFTRTATKDLVNNNISYGEWNKQNAEFEKVTSPVITGYTPDIDEIAKETVTSESNNLNKTVTYNANNQNAKITYIDDDTDHKILTSEDANGHYNEAINFKTNPDQQIKDFIKQGYKFVSNSFENNMYRADNNENVFEVHFVHNTETVTEHAKAQEIIHYVYADTKAKIHDDYISPEISYIRTGTKDQVTKQITWENWKLATDQAFTDHNSPKIPGYTTNQLVVSAPKVKLDKLAKDNVQTIETTVEYTANQQTANLNFVDDTTGATLSNWDTTTGKSDSDKISFANGQTYLDGYLKQGYEFVSVTNDTVKVEYAGDYASAVKNFGKFDHNDDEDQIFTVHLKHGIDQKSENKIITETVHYVFEDGQRAHDDFTTSFTFTRTVSTDRVTGKKTYGSWDVESHNFDKVESPTIAGYTPDIAEIEAITVAPTSENIERTVTYGLTSTTPGDPGDETLPPSDESTPPGDGSTTSEEVPPAPQSPDSEKKDFEKSSVYMYSYKLGKSQEMPKGKKHSSTTYNYKKQANKTGQYNNRPIISKVIAAELPKRVINHVTSKHNAVEKKTQNVLPETGEKQDKLGLFGLSIASIATLLGLIGDRKKKNK